MENMWTAASEKLATQLKEIQVQVFSIESFKFFCRTPFSSVFIMDLCLHEPFNAWWQLKGRILKQTCS